MRLSEAIALGSTMIKPLAGRYLNQDRTEGCAWGMIFVAAPTEEVAHMQVARMIRVKLPCGETGQLMGNGCGVDYFPNGEATLSSAIVHLFNYHVMTVKDWSLEKLIDWVRTVEPVEKLGGEPATLEPEPVVDPVPVAPEPEREEEPEEECEIQECTVARS